MKKTKTRQEVANEFGFSRSTFYRLLKELGVEANGKLLVPTHLAKIYRHIGFPVGMSDQEMAEWRKEISHIDSNVTHFDTN